MKNNPPKVNIDKINLIENDYTNHGKSWSAIKLIEHSKQFPVFDFPLVGFDLTRSAWKIDDMDDFIYHAKRCVDTDLKHPVIFDKWGTVADGWHRIAKAIILGRSTVPAIRLETMPPHDRLVEEEKDS